MKVIAAALWRLRPDPASKGPTRYVQCKDCRERSTPAPAQSVGDLWAMSHAGAKGHTRFQEIAASDLIAERDRRKRS